MRDALDWLTLVADASEVLASTLEVEPGLRRLCRVLVPGLADWCAIDLVDDSGRLRRVALEHRDSRVATAALSGMPLPEANSASAAPLARTLRGTEPLRLSGFPSPEQATDPLHRFELEAFALLGADRAVMVPLRARHRVLGALTLVRTGPEGPEEPTRLPLIADLAHRIALAVDNARLYALVSRTSEHLQRSLLPALPKSEPLELAARYAPARAGAEVGGDWYDAFLLPDGALALIIGDVTGHDLKAAVVMSQMRNMLRGIAADRKEPPGKILARLDAANAILSPGQILTCAYALLTKPDPDDGWKLHYASAGHPAPLVVTRLGEAWFLEEGRSLLLGVRPDAVRADAVADLPPNCTVLLYTDGLIERRTESLDQGMTRLRRTASGLANAPLETFCDRLMDELGDSSTDDIAMIAVRVPETDDRLTRTAE
ncbi:SpoIIE family protein phosphatase [Streptacidiphilus sp. P02-A3a]|nr:SpoIIE family protein phosphatase [Streptacidiphilus sp. P02-A3a]